MLSTAVTEKMLYCPKCQRTYSEGSQRFCSSEGSRLLPAPASGKSVHQTGGVFTNLLQQNGGESRNENSAALQLPIFKVKETYAPRPPVSAPEKNSVSKFRRPSVSKIFKPRDDIEAQPETKPTKPLPRIIKPEDVPQSQAKLGDRTLNPSGRAAISWENPQVLLGQTIKGRYFITDEFGADESSISFLAEDKLADEKRVVVRVLMDDNGDALTDKIFAEERVSLSHINHPHIVRVIDSGELLEGKSFVVTEYAEGLSVRDVLTINGQFNTLRAARIVRQAAYALSEVHQNGVLHRHLKPENIILTHTEAGAEEVKLTNFSGGKHGVHPDTLPYQSPEQIEGRIANFAGDEYSLAVIAYQMLTNRLPFNAAAAGAMLKAQRSGLTVQATNLRLDVPPVVDEILAKALSFHPSDRYPKARDFGDAFYNALTTAAPWEEKPQTTEKIEILSQMSQTIDETASADAQKTDASVKATEDLAWEKRSPEPPNVASASRAGLMILGVAVLLFGAWAIWSYLLHRPNEPDIAPTAAQNVAPVEQNAENQTNAENLPVAPADESEMPPIPRSITQPPNTDYFQNSKQAVKGDLVKNFLGFSLYYPKDWTRVESLTKFLDVSKKSADGLPVEQMLVSYYDSKGTFKADAENFPALVKKSNEDLKKILPEYEMISEGEKTINNGWRAYEVRFQSEGKTADGKKIVLWGKRLFIPVAIRGIKNGYVITMLATSLSPEVKSVDDVGVKGELSRILETFEPNQNF